MDDNDLFNLVKENVRASIKELMDLPHTQALRDFFGVKERIGPEDRQAVIEGRVCLLENAIDRCITNLVATARNGSTDAAANDIYEVNSTLGGYPYPRGQMIESIKHELFLTSHDFGYQLVSFKRMLFLKKRGLSNEAIWEDVKNIYPKMG